MKKHETMFEADVVLKIVQIQRECLLEFWNQESKVKAMLGGWLAHSYFSMVLVLV